MQPLRRRKCIFRRAVGVVDRPAHGFSLFIREQLARLALRYLWRGPLGVVNRGAIKQGKWSLLTIFKVRNLTLRWSIALWQGLFLGFTDALRGLNGHRKLFGKKLK